MPTLTKSLRRAGNRDMLAHPANLNHTAHMAMTLLTLGLWLPVWVLRCLRCEGWKSTHPWVLAGKSGCGLARLDRLDVSPETRRRLGF